MILIKPFLIRDQTFSNFLAKTISVVLHSITKCHSVRFSLSAYQKRKADSESEKTVSSDQPAQKKNVKPILVNSQVFQPQWLKQFDWLEYDAETKRLFCRT